MSSSGSREKDRLRKIVVRAMPKERPREVWNWEGKVKGEAKIPPAEWHQIVEDDAAEIMAARRTNENTKIRDDRNGIAWNPRQSTRSTWPTERTREKAPIDAQHSPPPSHVVFLRLLAGGANSWLSYPTAGRRVFEPL